MIISRKFGVNVWTLDGFLDYLNEEPQAKESCLTLKSSSASGNQANGLSTAASLHTQFSDKHGSFVDRRVSDKHVSFVNKCVYCLNMIFNDYEANNIIERVPEQELDIEVGSVHYLPHRPR